MVLIFGKDTCPYTQAARDDYAKRKVAFEYVNVKKNPADLERMLKYSGGRREVPVIVDGRIAREASLAAEQVRAGQDHSPYPASRMSNWRIRSGSGTGRSFS